MSIPAVTLDDVITTRLTLDSLAAACSMDVTPVIDGGIMSSYVMFATQDSHVSPLVKCIKVLES